LKKTINLNNDDLKICHKLSRAHLDIEGSKRQNVKPAQIFSNNNVLDTLNDVMKMVFLKQHGNLKHGNNKIFKLFND